MRIGREAATEPVEFYDSSPFAARTTGFPANHRRPLQAACSKETPRFNIVVRKGEPIMQPHSLLSRYLLLGTIVLLAGLATLVSARDTGSEAVMPRYDDQNQLLLPADYRQWIFVGSSLGMGYSESRGGMKMFHHVLMEPTAYQHFARSGAFREGTQFVLLLHGLGDGVLPQRSGHFADEIHGVEMAVKDSSHFSDGWAYFGFGGMGELSDRAKAFDSASCNTCHSEHAAQDNVFVQFYPLLREASPNSTD